MNKWFDNAVIYQIFIKSFYDSNNDGKGDIKGVIEKLDYIKSLGVNTILINTLSNSDKLKYEFSRGDLAYGSKNFKSIDNDFGTIADLKKLISEAHKKNIKIILDFINIAFSIFHPYFKDVVLNPESKYNKFFYTRNTKPEENWVAYGPGWTHFPNRYVIREYNLLKNNDLRIKLDLLDIHNIHIFYINFYFESANSVKIEQIKIKISKQNIIKNSDNSYSIVLTIKNFKKNKNKVYFLPFINSIENTNELKKYPNLDIMSLHKYQNFYPIYNIQSENGLYEINKNKKNYYINTPIDSRYYYALFGVWPFPNYKNKEVVEFMKKIADFWLSIGFDGFRLDAAKFIISNGPGAKKQENQPETVNYWKEFKDHIRKKFSDDIMLMAEILPVPIETNYFGKNRDIIDFLYDGVFAEHLYSANSVDLNNFTSQYLNTIFTEYNPIKFKIIYNSNHDRGRIASKIKNFNSEKGKIIAGLLLLSTGVPIIYYGDEIGISGKNNITQYHSLNALSTMSWNKTKHGGFTTASTSFPPLSTDYKKYNVASQDSDKSSLLNYYKKLIHFRKEHKLFSYGYIKKTEQTDDNIFTYILHDESSAFLIIHNISPNIKEHTFSTLKSKRTEDYTLIFSDKKITVEKIKNKIIIKNIPAYNSIVFKIENTNSNQILEKFPSISKSIKIKTGHYYSSNSLFKVLKNKDFAIKIKKDIKNKNTKLIYFDLEHNKLNKTNEFTISTKSEIIIPFSTDTIYFYFTEPIDFEIINFNYKNHFESNLKLLSQCEKNKTLKKIEYRCNDQFLFFKITKDEMSLYENGGYDFVIAFNNGNNEGVKCLQWWLLPKIECSLNIDSVIVYQHNYREKKPEVYTKIRENIQPGCRQRDQIIFQEIDNNFYIIVPKKLFPLSSYNVALFVWSAGGEWGEKAPSKFPIVEILPPENNNCASISKFINIK